MHWWVLACITCTGGVFSSMFVAYTSYRDYNLDCMVMRGGGSGASGGYTGGCCPCSTGTCARAGFCNLHSVWCWWLYWPWWVVPGSSTGVYIPIVELHAVTCTVWCGSGYVAVCL